MAKDGEASDAAHYLVTQEIMSKSLRGSDDTARTADTASSPASHFDVDGGAAVGVGFTLSLHFQLNALLSASQRRSARTFTLSSLTEAAPHLSELALPRVLT